MLKNLLSNMAIYMMSVFSMPASVEKRLNKIMRDFLWGSNTIDKKYVLVAWDKVCRTKEEGGLGIRQLRLTNDALLCKWSWRFSTEQDAL